MGGRHMECLSVVAGMSACCSREIAGYEVRGTDLLMAPVTNGLLDPGFE